MRAILSFLLTAFLVSLLVSCEKETETYPTEQLLEYMPLEVGKYITYQLDSTVFTNFGRDEEVHKYQEKNIIDAEITDAMGRPSYRVLRFLRDSAGTEPWAPAGSYMITAYGNNLEVMENNLRFVRLTLPIQLYKTWKGNRFLPEEPYPSYSFNNDFDIHTWDYTYTSLGETVDLDGTLIDDVITVDGVYDVINVPVTDPLNYGSINYQQEKYAKGIGMIFQELIMWEYQPNLGGAGGGFKVGFGVRRTMIDHN